MEITVPKGSNYELSTIERLEELKSYRQDLYYDLENFKEHSEHIWKQIKKVEHVIEHLLLYPYATIQQAKEMSELFKFVHEAKQPLSSEYYPKYTFTSAVSYDENYWKE